MCFKKISGSRVLIIIKTRLFTRSFLKKNQKYRDSSSGGISDRSSNSLIAWSFIKKETPAQVLLRKFYKTFQNNGLQNPFRRLVLICNFHRNCFSKEGSCYWLALMAAVNQIVITKVLSNYKTTFWSINSKCFANFLTKIPLSRCLEFLKKSLLLNFCGKVLPGDKTKNHSSPQTQSTKYSEDSSDLTFWIQSYSLQY